MKKHISIFLSTILLMLICCSCSSEILSEKIKISSFDLSGYSNGDIIEFGSYPQSRVIDAAVQMKINKALTNNWISYNYSYLLHDEIEYSDFMMYQDVEVDNNKFRVVTIKEQNRNSKINEIARLGGHESSPQYKNGYICGDNIRYYFSFDPIKWKILDVSQGLIMCESLIDSQPFTNYIIYNSGNYNSETHNLNTYFGNSEQTFLASDYSNSYIRSWLNNNFYNSAFSSDEKGKIVNSTIDNKGIETLNGKVGFEVLDSDDTNDNVFLLSYNDILNEKYGFSETDSNDNSRKAFGTDYAKCQGLGVFSKDGSSKWRLRTAGGSSESACQIWEEGNVVSSMYVNYTDFGIRPALYLNVK